MYSIKTRMCVLINRHDFFYCPAFQDDVINSLKYLETFDTFLLHALESQHSCKTHFSTIDKTTGKNIELESFKDFLKKFFASLKYKHIEQIEKIGTQNKYFKDLLDERKKDFLKVQLEKEFQPPNKNKIIKI